MHTIRLGVLLACIVFQLSSIYGIPRKNDFYFRSLQVEDGLSQDMVYAICQDRQGFMWFGTQDGLNRYDGISFKVYKKNLTDERSLKSDAIFCIEEDANGMLWIGTDCGVFLYNPVTDSFTRLALESNGIPVIGIVRSIVRDEKGNMWVGHSNKGVFKVTPDQHISFYPLSQYLNKNQGTIRSLCIGKDNSLWIATYQAGVLNLAPETGKLCQFLIESPNNDKTNNDVNHLCAYDEHTLLVGTVSHGLLQLDIRNGKFTTVFNRDSQGKNLFVRNIHINKNEKVWIGTETGLYIYSLKNNSYIHFRHVFNDSYSLSDNAIHSIYQDREGGVWLGTYFGGVNHFTESYAQFEKFYPVTGMNSISGKSISEFIEDESGKIWVGTEDGGLNCFDPTTGLFTQGFVPATNIHALLQENDRLWIGSFAEGLFTLNLRNGTVKNYRNILDNANIYSIYKDRKGLIWIGTMGGLYQYQTEKDRFKAIQEEMITLQVNDILEDSDGLLWFATLGQGIFTYEREKDKWAHFPTVIQDGQLRGKMAICLLETKKKDIWIGSESGLIRYDKQQDAFVEHYTIDKGLPNEVIYQLLEDSTGCIWGSTNKGLFCLNPESGKIVSFTHADGLLGDQFNYKSGLVSRSGKMYFGGVKGFVSFVPHQLTFSEVPPKVVFNSLQLNNEEVVVGNEPLKEHAINYAKGITLSHEQSVFSIGFVALKYAISPSIRYVYKLEGWDSKWINAGESHQATYSKLPPGNYVFRVKTLDREGTYGDDTASLNIRILSPFYRTVWAYLFYVLALSLFLYYIMKRYTYYIQKRNKRAMELLERQKEKELYDAKISFFTNITHEIRTPLSLIKIPMEEIMKKLSPTEPHYENLSIIWRNTNRLLKLVNELLDFRKAESDTLSLTFVHSDICVLVSETIKRFSQAAHTRSIVFEESYPTQGLMADVDVEVLTKTLSNLINNALKHAKTLIRISLENKGKEFRLIVTNDGDRIPTELAEKIFEPFVKLDENSEGTGLGLPFVHTLIEAHKGRIFLDITQADVTFVVVLPTQQKAVITPINNISSEMEVPIVAETKIPRIDMVEELSDKKTLLLVEDNEELQMLMSNQLKNEYRILKAHNGKEALELLGNHTIDLIISDVMMPVMDGISLCRSIKEDIHHSHIPVILLTAKTGLFASLDGLKVGADEYITKPYSIDFLKTRIENLIVNRDRIREFYKRSPESTIEEVTHSKADEDFLKKLVETIHSHLDEIDLDVDAIAVMMNMSRATLYRKVSSISDLTPNEFIRLTRLKKAAELLKEKKYRINEIALIVGFNSSSYFSKCFHKQFGVLPKDF